jgi:hypothetical protein
MATNATEHSLLGPLLRLRRVSYYTRYGNYVKHFVDAIREEARCHNLGEWQAIGMLRKPDGIEADLSAELGMWRETAAALNAEPYPETSNLADYDFSVSPTYYKIFEACELLAFNWSNMVHIIKMFALS